MVCSVVYLINKSYQNKQRQSINGGWQPNIETAEWNWNKNVQFNPDQNQDVIKFADNYLIQKLGEGFFDSYFHLNTNESRFSQDKSVYYLRYDMFIPEKGLGQKTTTHPTSFYYQFEVKNGKVQRKEDSVQDILSTDKIKKLKQLTFIDRGEAISIAKDYIKKDHALPESIILDFEPIYWEIRYDLPQESTPQCEFNMGSAVTLTIDADTKEVSQEIVCKTPGM